MDVTIKTDALNALDANLEAILFQAVRKAAFDIEARAKSNAPVDTGALRASLYTLTRSDDGYSAAAASATSKNAGGAMLPKTAPPGDLEAVVAVGAEYGLDVEFGTTRMGARPFLAPAVETARPQFARAVARAVKKAAGQ